MIETQSLCCLFFQLLLVFQKHKELIRRPTVSKELQSERETLLARLLDYNKGGLLCILMLMLITVCQRTKFKIHLRIELLLQSDAFSFVLDFFS